MCSIHGASYIIFICARELSACFIVSLQPVLNLCECVYVKESESQSDPRQGEQIDRKEDSITKQKTHESELK